MERRLKFRLGEQRQFLDQALINSGLTTTELARIVGVVGRSFRDWRREKLCINVSAAKILSQKFNLLLPEVEDELFNRWYKHKKIVARKGGFAHFSKYGSPATTEGRKKGGSNTLRILREQGIIPPVKEFMLPKKYNEQLAEFVGILLGDGGITLGSARITLNSEADREYLFFVVNLIKKLFNFDPLILKRKDCKANDICCNGIMFVEYLIKLGLKIGNKVKQQVGVPKWVKQSEKYKINCLRGLMDTDGGVFVHRYKVGGKEYRYLKISFSNRSIPILIFVRDVLKDLGLTPKAILNKENKQVWLYNQNEVRQYLQVVGTHNPRLLKHTGGVR